MKKKLLLLTILIPLIGLGVAKSQSQNSLILRFTNGTENGSMLAALDKITFSGTSMLLNYTNGTSGNFEESTIKNMIFRAVVSGVESVSISNSSKLSIYPNPASDYVCLQNAPDGELNFSIYALDGTILLSSKLISATQQIDISMLKKGFYVIKVSNQAMKFMKL
ncbi:MAG: T9SS type A sorting domain-containing protein [Paludibacter sp.]